MLTLQQKRGGRRKRKDKDGNLPAEPQVREEDVGPSPDAIEGEERALLPKAKRNICPNPALSKAPVRRRGRWKKEKGRRKSKRRSSRPPRRM